MTAHKGSTHLVTLTCSHCGTEARARCAEHTSSLLVGTRNQGKTTTSPPTATDQPVFSCGSYCGPNWCSAQRTTECAQTDGKMCVQSPDNCPLSAKTDGSCPDECCKHHDQCCGSVDRSGCNAAIIACLRGCPSGPFTKEKTCKRGNVPVPTAGILAAMKINRHACCGRPCAKPKQLVSTSNACNSAPCANGGVCSVAPQITGSRRRVQDLVSNVTVRCKCATNFYGSNCQTACQTVVNPSEQSREYSSVYAGDAKGTGHCTSTLDSCRGWSAANANFCHLGNTGACQPGMHGQQWMQINLPSAMEIGGVVEQGRHDCTDSSPYCCCDGRTQTSHVEWCNGQYVTKFRVTYSMDGVRWTPVGKDFQGAASSTRALAMFPHIVRAKHVRILVAAWQGGPSMRAALITCN